MSETDCLTCHALRYWAEVRRWHETCDVKWVTPTGPAETTKQSPGEAEWYAREPKAPAMWMKAGTWHIDDLDAFNAVTAGLVCNQHGADNIPVY